MMKIDFKQPRIIILGVTLFLAFIGFSMMMSKSNIDQGTFFQQKGKDKDRNGRTYPISYGALVSFECYSPRNYYLKQVSFMILATVEEKTQDDKLSSSFIIDEGLAGEDTVSIRSLNYPDYYLRVKNGFTLVLEEIDFTDGDYKKEASYYLRQGLADTSLISLELYSKPGTYLRQLSDQVVAAVLENSSDYKDDATWFIKPALAKVSHISIDFQRENYTITNLENSQYFIQNYKNNGSLPYVFTYKQPSQMINTVEYFQKTSGFNLIKGMTYKINARYPQLDMEGKIHFTAKAVREWTYGMTNNRTEKYLFESVVVVPENSQTKLSVNFKNANVSIPFEAQVHFEGVNFTQSYSGIWNGQFAYDYTVVTVDTDMPSVKAY